jgi:hypothetical protein
VFIGQIGEMRRARFKAASVKNLDVPDELWGSSFETGLDTPAGLIRSIGKDLSTSLGGDLCPRRRLEAASTTGPAAQERETTATFIGR